MRLKERVKYLEKLVFGSSTSRPEIETWFGIPLSRSNIQRIERNEERLSILEKENNMLLNYLKLEYVYQEEKEYLKKKTVRKTTKK